MSIIKEFQEFAVKGNVVDMAVGIIIGAAFGNIVNSMVSDIVMPPIGYLIGGVDFSNLQIILKEGVGATPPVAIKYGLFLNKVINFIVVAFSMFMVIKGMNHINRNLEVMHKKEDLPRT